jgi:hypothetical protein
MISPEIMLTVQEWNPVKITLISIAILLPAILAYLVFRYQRILKDLKRHHQKNQLLVQKRIEAHARIGPKLHDLLSFFCYRGRWKEITPRDVLALKKELDQDKGLIEPLFSDHLSEKFNGFFQLCFVSSTGWEHKERIKSLYELRQEYNVEWKDEWIPLFDTKNVADAITLKERYDELIASFKRDLNQDI